MIDPLSACTYLGVTPSKFTPISGQPTKPALLPSSIWRAWEDADHALQANPNWSTLQHYRQQIQTVFQAAWNTPQGKKSRQWQSYRLRIWQTTINQELEKLTRAVQQQNPTAILRSCDQIRGLLVDWQG